MSIMSISSEIIDLPPIDPANNRESELAAIKAVRANHPEWLTMARLYDSPEVRRTVSDIVAVADSPLRQSSLKSLLLALAGDPGSCDRLGYLYMSKALVDTEVRTQMKFWFARKKDCLK